MIKRALLIGTISGIFLGLSLKLVQALTGILVYTLLLNIDFIPIAGKSEYPEFVEFLIHLAVSIFIVWAYLKALSLIPWNKWVLAFLITTPAILLYFPLSVFAEKQVPSWEDWPAILFWTICHILYAITVAAFANKKTV